MRFCLTSPNEAITKMLNRRQHTVVQKWSDGFDVLLFTPGPHVCPFLYGEKLLPETRFDYRRDILENHAYRSVHHTFPKVGIDRGAHLLHILNGGSLFQKVDGHTESQGHYIKDMITGQVHLVASAHTQMMKDLKGAVLIAGARAAKKCESSTCIVDHGATKRSDNDWNDCEVLFHEKTSSLCFQPRPEYNIKECENYFFDLIDRYITPLATKRLEVHCG